MWLNNLGAKYLRLVFTSEGIRVGVVVGVVRVLPT